MNWKIFANSVFFVLGFTVVFSLIGVLLNSVLSNVAFGVSNALRIIGGSIIVLFGLYLIASLKWNIPFLMQEHKLNVKRFSNTYLTSFVFGVAFAAGWSPCVGAILGSIFALAASNASAAFVLLFAFSLGIGIPFLLAGAFVSQMSGFLKRIQGFLQYFNVIGGLFLIAVGILVVTNYIGYIAGFLGSAEGAVSAEGGVSIAIAFIAGLLAFLSPCILPLLPAFLAYISGTTASELQKKSFQKA